MLIAYSSVSPILYRISNHMFFSNVALVDKYTPEYQDSVLQALSYSIVNFLAKYVSTAKSTTGRHFVSVCRNLGEIVEEISRRNTYKIVKIDINVFYGTRIRVFRGEVLF